MDKNFMALAIFGSERKDWLTRLFRTATGISSIFCQFILGLTKFYFKKKENDLIQRAKVHREDWSMELEKSWIGFLYGNCDFAKITTCPQTISLWLLNSDDAFTAVHKDEINAFYDHLNK